MCWVAWDKLTLPKHAGGLGFRDVELFNDALLAKVGWRLIQDPTTLLARVLLGKYCHSSSFMEASSAPAVASHGWRSILLGRDILKKGLGWSVGNGVDIRLWQDPWLSLSHPKCPFGPPTLAASSLLVRDLLDPVTNEWNVDAVRQHLPQYEDDIRLLITSSHPLRDSLVWLPERSGIYSTKTGYAVAKTPLSTVPPTDWNKIIWQIKTAHKLQNFLWKVSHQALALGSNLAKRGLCETASCRRCGLWEDEIHVFASCPFAAKVWDLAPGLHKPSHAAPNSVTHLLYGACLMRNLPPTGIGSTPLAPWIFWNLWKARNKLLFEDKHYTEHETILKAITDAREWFKAQTLVIKIPKPKFPATAPRRNLVQHCVHVDAAWLASSRRCGMGWTFTGPDSTTISSFTANREFVASALVAEALAMRCALTMATDDPDIASLTVMSDSQVLITMINSKESTTELKGILHDIALLTLSFTSISFVFIPRAANVLADSLAKSALMALSAPLSVGM